MMSTYATTWALSNKTNLRDRVVEGAKTDWLIQSANFGLVWCLRNAASSDGRCNTCAPFTRWRFESQCLSGSLIQAQRDMVELRLRKTRQVGASREVLPQEQIGVFIAAALPGTLWSAEVDLHIPRHRKLLVLGHLQSAIPSQRTF